MQATIMSSNFSPVNLSASPVAQASLQASYCMSKVLMCFCSSATHLGGKGAVLKTDNGMGQTETRTTLNLWDTCFLQVYKLKSYIVYIRETLKKHHQCICPWSLWPIVATFHTLTSRIAGMCVGSLWSDSIRKGSKTRINSWATNIN